MFGTTLSTPSWIFCKCTLQYNKLACVLTSAELQTRVNDMVNSHLSSTKINYVVVEKFSYNHNGCKIILNLITSMILEISYQHGTLPKRFSVSSLAPERHQGPRSNIGVYISIRIYATELHSANIFRYSICNVWPSSLYKALCDCVFPYFFAWIYSCWYGKREPFDQEFDHHTSP